MTYVRRLVHETELLPTVRLVGLHLRDEADPQTVAQIAQALNLSESTVSRAVRVLEQHGWARKIHTLWTGTEDKDAEDQC